MYDPWTWTEVGSAGGKGGAEQKGIKGEKWGNCNSIINKIYFQKKNRWKVNVHRESIQLANSKQSISFCVNHSEGSSGRDMLVSLGAGFSRENWAIRKLGEVSEAGWSDKKPTVLPWLVWLSGLSVTATQNVTSLIPSQGTCLGCRPVP